MLLHKTTEIAFDLFAHRVLVHQIHKKSVASAYK